VLVLSRASLVILFAMAIGCGRLPANPARVSLNEADRQQVVDRVVASTVKVIVERDGKRVTSASGVVIASRPAKRGEAALSYVLTAAHALGGENLSVFVGFCGADAEQGRLLASVIHRGTPDTLDLALLRIAGIEAPPALFLEGDRVPLGRPVLVVGFPDGERLGLTGGIVSQLPLTARENGIPAERPEARITIDAAAPRGVSGGGAFEADTGRLIGIVQGYQTLAVGMKDHAQSYTLRFPIPASTMVIPLGQIRPFLLAANAALDLRVGHVRPAGSFADPSE
jgi:S1-C subfamily serine protease